MKIKNDDDLSDGSVELPVYGKKNTRSSQME